MTRTTRFFLLGGAAGILAATAMIFGAKASSEHWEQLAQVGESSVAKEPAPEPTELVAKTGDQFWGLHLEGVIPCSSMLVRGGGHLVILTRDDRPMDKCSYHVKGKKTISLGDRQFVMSVVGDDTIRVTRALDGAPVAADSAGEADVEQIAGQP